MKPLIKCFTSLGALFFLAVGLAILGLTIYLFFNSSIFLGNQNIQYIVLGTSLGLSIAIIGFAAEGIYGICKEKPKLICVFQIVVILFSAIFIALGVGVILLPGIFFNNGCSDSSNVVINYANNMYNLSEQVFCQDPCPCKLDNKTSAFNTTYNQTEKDFIASNYTMDPNAGNVNTEVCIQKNLTDPEIALFSVVGEIESFLSCSLWCEDQTKYNLIYRFGDVNSGKPQYFCYTRLKQLYDDYSIIGRYVLFGAGGVLFLMFLCNMYLCCCAKSRKGANARDRFMLIYNDQQDDRYHNYNRNRGDYRQMNYDYLYQNVIISHLSYK